MDYKKIVTDKETELGPLFSRMDTDKDLYYGKAFEMKDSDGKAMPKVENVTLPDAILFAAWSVATLMSANQQVVVESEVLKDKETTHIEDFIEDAFTEIDNRLVKRGTAGLYPFLVEQGCIRGHLAARSLVRVEKKNVIMDVLPLDTRYFLYELGVDGFIWAAYKTQRTKARILSEYGIEVKNDKETVIDAWDEKINQVWIGDEMVKEQKNPYGYVPFVLQLVPAGSMLQDEDSISHKGESIFALSRILFPEMNKTVSILQTLNIRAIKPPLQYESKEGTKAKLPEKPPYGTGSVVAVDAGGGYKEFPVADIHNATRLFYSIFESRLQRTTLSATDLGNLTFPLSAVALTKLTAEKEQILLPRLQALATFQQQLSKMIIKQFQAANIKADLGEEGHRRTYSPKELDGEYTIKYRYFSTSPEQNIANYSIANAAGNLISDDTKRRDILKLEDPDGEAAKCRAELAEKLDPAIALYRQSESLIDEGRDIEARLVAERLVALLKQRQMGAEQITSPETPSQPGNKALLPLFAKGGGTPAKTEEGFARREELVKGSEEGK